MKKVNKSPIIYLVLLMIALGSLAYTTVSAVRATPSEESDEYTATMISSNIGVTLQEGDSEKDSWTKVAYRNYNGSSWDPAKGVMGSEIFAGLNLEAGVSYKDEFRVMNSGTIDEFVRVIVYKYWLDEEDNKDTSLDASLITLDYNEAGNWVKDTKFSTSEKEIWYYLKPLAADDYTDVLIKGLKLDGAIKLLYTKDEIVNEVVDESGKTIYTTITYDYAYNGKSFKVLLEVDGVQIKHGEDAVKSAWGRDVTVGEDGSLKLQ